MGECLSRNGLRKGDIAMDNDSIIETLESVKAIIDDFLRQLHEAAALHKVTIEAEEQVLWMQQRLTDAQRDRLHAESELQERMERALAALSALKQEWDKFRGSAEKKSV